MRNAPLHARRHQATACMPVDRGWPRRPGSGQAQPHRSHHIGHAYCPDGWHGLRPMLTPEAVREALEEAGLPVLDLRAWFAGVRQNHAPDSPEREQAEAAITAINLLADRRTLAMMAACGCLAASEEAHR